MKWGLQQHRFAFALALCLALLCTSKTTPEEKVQTQQKQQTPFMSAPALWGKKRTWNEPFFDPEPKVTLKSGEGGGCTMGRHLHIPHRHTSCLRKAGRPDPFTRITLIQLFNWLTIRHLKYTALLNANICMPICTQSQDDTPFFTFNLLWVLCYALRF